ncbi:MAG: hypothetical protein WC548_04190 [Candidatus Pacearchaeota archaeon]
MAKRNLTGFIGFTTSPRLHLRTYVHEFGLCAFRKRECDAVDIAMSYVERIVQANCRTMNNNFTDEDGVIAFTWGNKGIRMIDFYKMTYGKVWQLNPTARAFVYKDGLYQPDCESDTCGDGLIILGEEEKFRRMTTSGQEYFNSPSPIKIRHFFGIVSNH